MRFDRPLICPTRSAFAPMDVEPLSRSAAGSGQRPARTTRASAPAAVLMKGLEDMKAQDIVQVDLRGKSDFADFLLIASGTSSRHVASIAQRLVQLLKEAGEDILGVEGIERGDWVLIDTGETVVHLFRPEVRDFYNLEKMWTDTVPA